MAKEKKASAGWYPVEVGERFWDGAAWTDQRRGAERPCPYCMQEIPRAATRCSHCAGELRHCRRCDENVGLDSKQKFVGLLRGGMKTRYSCMNCGTILDGPRW